MAIDINKPNNAANTQNRSAVKGKVQSEQPAQTNSQNAAAQKTDSVTISSPLLGSSKLASIPEVDQHKVAEIKQAIAEGNYKIDPEKLAANIASFEKDLQDLDDTES